MGGVIAFEMARQLWDANERVALVAMVDAPPAEPEKRNLGSMDEDTGFLNFARDLLGSQTVDRSASARAVLDLDPAARLAWLFELAQGKGLVPADLGLPHFRRRYDIFRRNLRALSSYLARPLPGSITFLRAMDSPPGDLDDPARGWGRLGMGGMTWHALSGNHYSILQRPHVLGLAQTLRTSIETAMAGWRPGVPSTDSLPVG
jgi:thioesterase domain-containing protein